MPECQKIKNSGLDQYGAERFGRRVFATVRKSVGLKGLRVVCCLTKYMDRLRYLIAIYRLCLIAVFMIFTFEFLFLYFCCKNVHVT